MSHPPSPPSQGGEKITSRLPGSARPASFPPLAKGVRTGDMGGARSETWVTLFPCGRLGLERRPSMPWNEVHTMSLRTEFVQLAQHEGANISELCRRFDISRKTGYKWLARFRAQGDAGLADQSLRPTSSPTRTPTDIETEVLRLRDCHPTWGGRKLHARLVALDGQNVPSPSTITAILRRHDRLDPAARAARN